MSAAGEPRVRRGPKPGYKFPPRPPKPEPDWSAMPELAPEGVQHAFRAWRTGQSLTLKELGELLGVSHVSVIAAEKGGPVSERMARRLAALRAGGPDGVKALRASEIFRGRK